MLHRLDLCSFISFLVDTLGLEEFQKSMSPEISGNYWFDCPRLGRFPMKS